MESGEQQQNLVKLSEEEELHLGEPWQDIRGLDVYDVDGEQIGSVEELYVERDSRLPRFLVVSAGGFLGLGRKHFLIPVEEVSRDMGEQERVTLNRERDKVVGSPNFETDEAPPSDVQRAVLAYYGLRT
jgi:sporulation protein YlmC with PRC-barrel domain